MYLYQLNYPIQEQDICHLEMKHLFGREPSDKTLLSERFYEAGRSIYFKARMDILSEAQTLSELSVKVSEMNIGQQTFKVIFLKNAGADISYDMRLEAVRTVSAVIHGQGEIHFPDIVFGIAYVKGKWLFGKICQDHQSWQKHRYKPQSYSQSLSVREARTLVNIASFGQSSCKLVDPCCGVGTVVLEALSLGHCMDASDIHPGICWKANRNLAYFGYPQIVQCLDIAKIKKRYDTAILDIPYNLYSRISPSEQQELICHCYRISQALVLVSYEPLSDMLEKAGWKVTDVCTVRKMKFQRYIYYCQKAGGKS